MPRDYTHMKSIELELVEMKNQGSTHTEIAKYFNLTPKQVENCLYRYNQTQKRIALGILPLKRGRLPKNHIPSELDKDNLIKRLKMENELLRDFLRTAGRR